MASSDLIHFATKKWAHFLGTDVLSPSSKKNFELLIHAFAIVAAERPEWKLMILGEGEDRPALEAQVAALGLRDRISLPGRTKAPYAALRAAAFYVLSSRYEGFPLTLCEALASGKAVIATDCPTGPRDILQDGELGILVPSADQEAMAQAMLRLIDDQSLRTELEKGAPQILNYCGLPQVAKRWEAVISSHVI